jgi:hypothetical protein
MPGKTPTTAQEGRCQIFEARRTEQRKTVLNKLHNYDRRQEGQPAPLISSIARQDTISSLRRATDAFPDILIPDNFEDWSDTENAERQIRGENSSAVRKRLSRKATGSSHGMGMRI